MAKYATLKDVAEKAGTTPSTVSYVLSNKSGRYISKKTREKVMKAVRELDYIKSIGAASLKGKEVKLVGILVPQFENQFFTRIIVASEKILMKAGYDLIICDTLDNPIRERDFIRRMIEQRVDGLVVTPSPEGGSNTARVRRIGIPMVVVDRQLAGVNEDYYLVATDNYKCSELAAANLLSHGHKKAAFIGWDTGISDLLERRRAAQDVYRSKGELFIEEDDLSDEGGKRAVMRVMEQHPDVTAFLFGFNLQAKGGIKYLTNAGKIIGKDISVVLIGSPEWVTAGNNNFTHVHMGDEEVGARAAELLLKLIKRDECLPCEKKLVQACSLVEGASVADIT
ncbi:LacI family DNA-binding transcriptional regulator [Treponema sp. OMZ 840]|uniref:LacI family DNA-binding transcriptional regulator n=1 Tax=Treponema sp. OMZ 840 TaxID=244313 RepID=UPI003D8FE5A2